METKVSTKTDLGMGQKFKSLVIGTMLAGVGSNAALAAQYGTTQTGTISGATNCAANSFLERLMAQAKCWLSPE